MPRVCVLVPFAFDEKGLANRRLQQESVKLGADMELDYKPVKAGPALYDSYHDYLLADFSMLEAGIEAEAEGYDAVCIDTVSDSGMNALRSVVDIPVIGPGKASYMMALTLGQRFSVLTQWDPWVNFYKKTIQEYGLDEQVVSIRTINTPPDVENLLGGKEDEVFPKLKAVGMECIEEGADVICLGSTTMHQSYDYLSQELPVPVINPGPLSYKLAETVLALGLTHSRKAYPKPRVEKAEMIHAMADAAAGSESAAAGSRQQ